MRAGAALLIAALLAGCAAAPSGVAYIPSRENPRCAVTEIVDGDTVNMACGSRAGPVRLVGFDTPETFRPRCTAERRQGERAKALLAETLRSARLIAPQVQGKDKYGRTLVRLAVDGRDLADIMVGAGLAVRYSGGKRPDWCARLNG